jgi:UDP-N-acetylmuramyl pentapeptide synthase
MAKIILLILTLTASASPVLTLARLWQVKEWRWDRLLEHLRREGFIRSLWGLTRPIILIVAIITATPILLSALGTRNIIGFDMSEIVTIFLIVLSLMWIMQEITRKQRAPVWSVKTACIILLALLMTELVGLWLLTSNQTTLVPNIGGQAFFHFLYRSGARSFSYFGSPRRLFGLLILPYLQPVLLAIAWALFAPIDTAMKRRVMERARTVREKFPNLTVIGVTGSVGKTTTKELLACALSDLHPLVTPAYVNSEIGVARWLIAQEDSLSKGETQTLIVELGAYRMGEIARMCRFVQPTIGVVTAVTAQHVALFGSLENVQKAKAELVESLPNNGNAFLNGDNERVRSMAHCTKAPVCMVGTGGTADVEAFDIEETMDGIRFRSQDTVFNIPLHGTHNVVNVLLALCVGTHLGLSLARIRALLSTFRPLSGTFSVRSERGVRIMDDTHNSSAASVKAAIAWARNQPEEKKVLVMSGLIEMGELQAPAEREIGGLASVVFHRIIVLDSLSARNVQEGSVIAVEKMDVMTSSVQPGTLLVCCGRMPKQIIPHLLPRSH